MKLVVQGAKTNVNESFSIPGDKSIAHRALIIGALGKGNYLIENFPSSLDCLATLDCMNKMGVVTEARGNRIFVTTPGYENFNKSIGTINAKNSGTSARLLSGLICGSKINCKLIGDESLSMRPMDRIINPLELMGANIFSESNNRLPLYFNNTDNSTINNLKNIRYVMPVASAQVKSCVLIAGFLADGITEVIENIGTRNHTENMFKYLGANIKRENNSIFIKNSIISCKDIVVPGDISSAAFIIACALLGENCSVKLENILLNEGRSQYLDILKQMGANIKIINKGKVNEEYIGDIEAYSSELKAIDIEKHIVPSIIDEIPTISILAALSKGTTVINGVDELKYKESNRINGIIENLNSFGIKSSYEGDKLIIYGNDEYINKNVEVKSFNDHRIAMAFLALSMKNKGETSIANWECTEISFPNAIDYFKQFLNLEL